ncbi:MAG: sigma-70 family RNA polymerase sigma factor [Bacilli bacterium]|nr:sigma-70 family RNA polymerase sigma factor [Bacilli bacterium]
MSIFNNYQINDNLMKKISKNDSNAIEFLFNNSKKMIFSIALSITKSRSISEDITQDIIIKIIENIDKYQYNNNPLSWIYTLTKNHSLNVLKKESKNYDIDLLDESRLIKKELNSIDSLILSTTLSILSDEEKEIIMLHSSGLKHKEIAKIYNKPLSTILSKYNRAIIKMRNYLEK